MQETEQRHWKSFVRSLRTLPLSHIHFVFPTTALLTHTHSYTPTPRADAYDTALSHTCCPLHPPLWKTLLWVCESVPRCKDVIGRHGRCAWESVFFTWIEKNTRWCLYVTYCRFTLRGIFFAGGSSALLGFAVTTAPKVTCGIFHLRPAGATMVVWRVWVSFESGAFLF